MTGGTDNFDGKADRSVDRSDDTQGQVKLIQNRTLLDMYFEEPECPCRITAAGVDAGRIEACHPHGFSHGDALGVGLVQPAWIELTDDGAGTEERRAIALALL